METTESRFENSRCCGTPRHRVLWIILGIAGFIAFAFLFGAVVMWLWNWLMPVIFHLGVITYWQAVGLALLGRLLIGGFHHGGHHRRGHHRFGLWRHRHPMGNGMKWNYYEQYWNEEGENAFNEYVKRKSGKTE
jgi:hypothetical protein